jgi:excisionase family DNA binding protein
MDQYPTTLGAEELAMALQISKTTAYELLRSKDFPTLKIGRRLLVTKEDLLNWIRKKVAA